MTLTKAKLVASMDHRVLLTKDESAEAIEHLLAIMKKTLESGDDIMISGFGRFTIKEKKARNGRNPATGQPMVLRARKVVTFKPAKKLVDYINGRTPIW